MWNFNFTQLRGRNLYGSKATEELTNKVVNFTNSGEKTGSFAFDDKNVQNDDKNVQNDDKNVQGWTKMSKVGQKCPNEIPEPLPGKDSGTPQTIQKLQTKKTLSDQREKSSEKPKSPPLVENEKLPPSEKCCASIKEIESESEKDEERESFFLL
jgi:hypothetical protein